MVLEKLESLAINIEKANGKTLFEFDGRIFISCKTFSGFFEAVVFDEDKLVCFDGISPFARIILSDEFDSIKFE